MRRELIGCVVGAGIAISAHATDPSSDAVANALAKVTGHDANVEVGDFLKSLTVDMPVTTPPATFLLGLGGMAVPRISTFRAFGTQLAKTVGDDGKLHGNVAAEINPLLASGPVSWKSFNSSVATRVLTRTTVSVATLSSDSDTSARSAFGVQSVLYSAEADELLAAAALDRCAAAAPEYQNSTSPGTTMPGNVQPKTLPFTMTDKAQADAKACQERIEGLLTKWNPTAITIGLGQAQFSSDGTVGRLRSTSGGVWISATLGYDWDKPTRPQGVADAPAPKKAQDRLGLGATFHVRRMWHERATDPADLTTQVDEDSTLLGLNVRGGNAHVGGLLEASLRKGKAQSLRDENRKRIFAGLEVRLMEGVYVVAGVGSETGRRDGKNQHVGLLNLKWGFSRDTVLMP